ncbi:MAG TPA: molybdate ABC transporter substrate-binding protein [Azoarcus sp.]|nr:molybdate ABC transporter substrate-binding protein [Azoarcus sp.]
MRTALPRAFIVACVYSGAAIAQPADEISLYAAGSLRGALTEVVEQFTEQTGQSVVTTFAPSGLLRERIEAGAEVQVFASANVAHPARLAEAGGWTQPVVFARNNLCGLAQPEVAVHSDNLLDVLLDPAVRVGTSTPKADPSGDYAWGLFEKAETLHPGAFSALDAKALKLTGGPDSAPPPEGVNQYAWVMDEDRADIFLTYCTNAVAAQKALPKLQIIEVPDALAIGATYGMTVREGASQGAALAEHVLSPEAQAILKRYGFGAI